MPGAAALSNFLDDAIERPDWIWQIQRLSIRTIIRLIRRCFRTAAGDLARSKPCQAQFHTPGCVHIEQSNRCASFRRQATYTPLVESEVIAPDVLSGIEKRDRRMGSRIDASEIRPFVCIAAVACER